MKSVERKLGRREQIRYCTYNIHRIKHPNDIPIRNSMQERLRDAKTASDLHALETFFFYIFLPFCCCCCLLLHSLLIYEYARKRLQKEFDSVRRPMLVNEIYLFPLHPFPSFSSSLLPNHKGVLCSEFSVAHLSWSGAEGGASWSYREKGRGQIWMESGALSVGKIV